jgi:hypothetical protein
MSTRRIAPGSIRNLPRSQTVSRCTRSGSPARAYIRASKYPQPAFDQALAECKADKSWRTFETTAAGHDVMVDAPDWLAEVLVEVS